MTRMRKMKNKTYKRYLDYLKDNPERYWFKRRLYGWGWTPATWEGWLTLLIFVVATVYSVQEAVRGTMSYWIILVVLVAILITIGAWKGERPGGQWGIKKKN